MIAAKSSRKMTRPIHISPSESAIAVIASKVKLTLLLNLSSTSAMSCAGRPFHSSPTSLPCY